MVEKSPNKWKWNDALSKVWLIDFANTPIMLRLLPVLLGLVHNFRKSFCFCLQTVLKTIFHFGSALFQQNFKKSIVQNFAIFVPNFFFYITFKDIKIQYKKTFNKTKVSNFQNLIFKNNNHIKSDGSFWRSSLVK